ncbi:23S rRNA (uracil(1939)-C(5))-methyltransferase RlmD [Mangrovibacillus cuniculi]|uniref:23S rRNA (Uracil(1939)-C(5))-methyltransferase RlmD n=1 Tax=Mangrovibacillus cuniculi TaxID=2593652 RepID=A0A7S8C8S6_9BACI|nr:23S rRNA (uracil(1939)-C(5))-methyltransferase RlmD [Mangrovibacillus cuniculi]QPC45512.1 23S rRNA (uracil(1939)-C(5))-methyltransferase RlmD [Mangrovibacillus cuniculi]
MSKFTAPVKKNDVVEVTAEDLTHEGLGVAKVDGYPIFTPNTLPGEKAEIRVVKTQKGYAFGRLQTLISESPDRVEPPCPIYSRCGGCQTQHLSYDGQLRAKQKQVKDLMKKVAKLPDVPVHPTIGMDEHPWNYRNKAQMPVGEQDGKLVAGFYAKRTHEIIDMDHCLIQQEKNDEVLQIVKAEAERLGVRPYDEKTHKGTLRHVMTRVGRTSGEIMVVLITRTPSFPQKEALVSALTEKISGLTSVVHNINNKRTNVIFGEETNTLWGADVIYDNIGDIRFAISARSFYQINSVQTKVLYDKALEYAQLTGEENVIDAYCGIGTISLFLAQQAKHVYGVEIVPEAIEDAKVNAKLNNISNATFEAGPAEVVIPNWYKNGITADVLVVDPPRKGCDQALLDTIMAMKPKRVVYVSCNPATLARDLRVLEDGGYKTVKVQPVDMFPQTSHVEAVAMLTLK